MAASCSFAFNTLQQRELFSFSLCKCFSTSTNPLDSLSSSPFRAFVFSSPKHNLLSKFSSFLAKAPFNGKNPVNCTARRYFASLEDSKVSSERLNSGHFSSGFEEDMAVKNSVKGKDSNLIVEEKNGNWFVNNGKPSGRSNNFSKRSEKGSGISSSGVNYKRADRKMEENVGKVPVEYNGNNRKGHNYEIIGQKVSGSSQKRPKNAKSAIDLVNGKVNRQPIKDKHQIKAVKKEKMSKKIKADSPEFRLRIGLDKCSKMGDVMGAISQYDSAVMQGVKMGQYHYTVLLYLCSSAAMGVIRPAKSGSASRSLDTVSPQISDGPNDYEEEEDDDDSDDSDDESLNVKDDARKVEIRVSEEVKKYALEKGFEIYERMCLDKVQMNEAALTSVARMAMAMGNGDMAFDMVKQMKSMGINPKLRSYGPALSAYSSSGDVEKAFAVEEHMLENGVQPEAPELEALLGVSIQNGKADRVYYLLHKLRTNVRSVSPSTADLIEKWFRSTEASRVGKRKWEPNVIAQIMENVGGGWHGQGWLGRGKWTISRTSVGADGLCKCCGEKLALIDLDPEETERFAESVASLAIKREKNSSFQKFQRWLDYYGPFEAVVDAANVGLLSQRKFKPSKVNVVVNGIRNMLPSKKWPLIVLHNRRLTGSKMDQPVNNALVERWKNADALYATPTGSNDDWYWLFAAIKCKCLIVTNDEMRDHTFQLLGTDFFPKWKERHQVRFNFSEVGPVFHMPPPCSVVIQESEKGHWHIPIVSDHQSEEDRVWLCISRLKLQTSRHPPEETKESRKDEKVSETSASESQPLVKASPAASARREDKTKEIVPKVVGLKLALSEPSSPANSDHVPVLNAIKNAEKLGGCVVDFQI